MPLRVKRIGALLPPNDVTLEYEFVSFAPEGVTVHSNRLARSNDVLTADSLLEMVESLESAAKLLAHTHPDVMVYGCTTGSLLVGPDEHRRLGESIREHTGIAGITTATAVLDAFAALGTRKVFIVTPYPRALNQSVIDFLAHHGIRTVGLSSFLCETGSAVGYIDSAETAARVLANRGEIARSDAVFVSCTNLRAMDQVEGLEAALGVPMVTSNQATLWAALNEIGVDTGEIRAGRLFRLGPGGSGRRSA
jgi:maleate isomerase